MTSRSTVAARLDAEATSRRAGRAGGGPPGDTVGRLFVALARLTKRLRRDAPAAIGHGSVAALATVIHEGTIRVGDLATLEGVRAPTMTRIVDGLVAEGYAERVPDPADGRACLVRATAAGAAMIAGTRSARADLLAARFNRLTEPQRAALAAALPALEALCTDDPAPPRDPASSPA